MKKLLTTGLIVVFFMAMSSSAFAWDKTSNITTYVGDTKITIGVLYSCGQVDDSDVFLEGKVVKKHWAVIYRQMFFQAYFEYSGTEGLFVNANYAYHHFDDYNGYYKAKVSGTCWFPNSTTGAFPSTTRHYYYD